MSIAEKYKFNGDGHEFILEIHDKHPRFNGEGVLEMVTLYVNGREMYRDTFGREKSLNFLISDFDNEFVDMSHEKANRRYSFRTLQGYIILHEEQYNMFINWLIESLTPKNIKRIHKINRIKDKLLITNNI